MKKRLLWALVVAVLFAGFVSYSAESNENSNRKPDLMYLANMPNKPWWNKKFKIRIPVLVSETAGIARQKIPVNFICELPSGATHKAIRIVTPWGKETLSQTNRLTENKVEIIFLTDLKKYEQKPFFIYLSDEKVKPATNFDTDLSVELGKDSIVLQNDALRIKLFRTPASPQPKRKGPAFIREIHIRGSKIDNELTTRQPDYSWVGMALEYMNFSKGGRITEEGPLRITVEFEGKEATLKYFFYSNSNMLHYRIIPKVKSGILKTCTGWGIGGSMVNDKVLYPAKGGTKRLKGSSGNMARKDSYQHYKLKNNITAGWVGLYDRKKLEVAGEFFDLKQCASIEIWCHPLVGGEDIIISRKLSDGALPGVLIAYKGVPEELEAAYQQWKLPPTINIGELQKRKEIPIRTPCYTRDNIREFMLLGIRDIVREDNKTATVWVDKVQELGGNSIKYCCQFPVWESDWREVVETRNKKWMLKYRGILNELVEAAHKKGMTVRVWGEFKLAYKIPRNFCCFDRQNRRKLIEDYIKQAKTGVDLVYIDTGGEGHSLYANKWGSKTVPTLASYSKYCREEYRKQYGLELPQWKSMTEELKMISKGAPYSYPAIFLEDEYLKLTREIVAAVKKARPDVPVSILTSGAGSLKRDVDIESKAPYLDTIETEICVGKTPNLPHIKFGVKYPLAVMGNDGNAVQHHFYFEEASENFMTGEMEIPLMFGIKSFCQEEYSYSHMSPEYLEITETFYKFLDYTGLGKFLPDSVPLKHAVVFRDWSAYRDDLLKGDFRNLPNPMPAHDSRCKEVMAINNLPVDIIVSRFFTLDELKKYKVLIIPSDKVLSDKHAKIISNYVESGGSVVAEAHTLDNPLIEKIAGVVKIKTTPIKVRVASANEPLLVIPDKLNAPYTIQVKTAKILVSDDEGNPVLAVNKFGEGKFYYSPCFLTDGLTGSAAKRRFFRKLLEIASGTLPLILPESMNEKIETSIVEKNGVYLVGVYNTGKQEIDGVKIKLNLKLSPDFAVINLKTGERLKCGEVLPVAIQPLKVAFFLIGPEDKLKVPTAKPLQQSAGYL